MSSIRLRKNKFCHGKGVSGFLFLKILDCSEHKVFEVWKKTGKESAISYQTHILIINSSNSKIPELIDAFRQNLEAIIFQIFYFLQVNIEEEDKMEFRIIAKTS